MNIQCFVRRVLLALVAGAALCGGSFATANSVTLIPTGFAAGSESFDFTGEPFSPVSAGAFAGTLDGNPIVFFCFELTQTFSFGTTYTYDDSIPSGPKYTALSELFTEGFGTALSSTDFVVTFQRGTEWAATGNVTQKVPDDFPTAEKVSVWEPKK